MKLKLFMEKLDGMDDNKDVIEQIADWFETGAIEYEEAFALLTQNFFLPTLYSNLEYDAGSVLSGEFENQLKDDLAERLVADTPVIDYDPSKPIVVHTQFSGSIFGYHIDESDIFDDAVLIVEKIVEYAKDANHDLIKTLVEGIKEATARWGSTIMTEVVNDVNVSLAMLSAGDEGSLPIELDWKGFFKDFVVELRKLF